MGQAASSNLVDFGPGTRFQPVLADPLSDRAKVQRVVLLSGKVYYELVKERQARSLNDVVALVRIEELAPFPFAELEQVLSLYSKATKLIWLQEEPRNQGANTHAKDRILSVLEKLGKKGLGLEYIGRQESSIPAPGIGKLYQSQQKKLVEGPFEGL